MNMKLSNGKRNLARFGALLVLVALWVIIPFVIGDRTASAEELLSDTQILATLTGSPIDGVTPTGLADYSADDRGRRRLDVQGSNINLAAGTTLTVSINNAVIGTANVTTCNTIFFRLRTDDGQTVPVITAGMPVQISNGGNVVLAGTFGSATPSPSPSGSPSPSPSASPCVNPSPSPTGSPNGTPSPSPSPTGSPNGTPSPSPSPTGSPASGDLFAGLSGAVINGILPNGFAQFEIHSSRLELEVRVQQVNLPAGTQLAVIVDNINVGSMFISSSEGRLRLRTDNGQTVPPVIVGSTISIRNGGTTILSGTFMGFAGPSPSPSPSPTGTPTGSPSPSPSPTASPSPSPSLGRSFEANLTGAGMTPPVQTGATGEFKVTLNATETQATIFGEFHNLSSNQTGARIEALVGDGVVVHTFGVVGGLNGNFASVTIDVSAGQVSQLRAGLWSAVITSVNNPNGEIRSSFRQRSNLADFDGDGSSDFALFRPSSGAWYSLNGAGFSASQFGGASDKVVSADYDGDGRTDSAVFSNVNGLGVWQVKRSSDTGISAEQFGLANDLPARGDFDGDGINDLAVYRPSTGVWYIKHSSGTGFTITRFGLSEDKPLPLDMDGDGRDDIAVFRPSEGNWYWLRSSDGQFNAAHFGLTGDIPVRGDFDGDGKSDITVYRPSTGAWYSLLSSNGSFMALQFGLDGDIPVAGRYDGDNKTDVAVFRPSDGHWYILRSSDGAFQSLHFGLSGDVPTIAR
jgi:hypothetical protein